VTIQELRAAAARRLNELIAERQRHQAALAEMRSKLDSGTGDVAAADVDRIVSERAAVDSRIDETRAELDRLDGEIARDAEIDLLATRVAPSAARPSYDAVARVESEQRTYTRASNEIDKVSFFRDFYRARHSGDYQADDRLRRHMVEAQREGELSERALATGGVAGLVVPQYLVDMAAPVLRAGRPFANLANGHQLPAEGMSLVIPRGTTGAAAAAQATQNTAVQNTDEVWSDLTVPVVTVAGQQQVSRQLLDRGTPGTDSIIYMDLARAYHANLDGQTITGTGSGGTMLGIQNTAGIGAATAFGAAPGAANFNLKVAGQITSVTSAGSGIFAKFLLMHPRRWGWLLGLVDSSNRPIVTAETGGIYNALAVVSKPGQGGGDPDPISGAQFVGVHSSGLPVLTDLNVPTNVGTNVEDLVFAVDNAETHLWEDGDGMPRELRFEQTLGNQLTTTLVVAGYAAFTSGRYPAAVGKIGGLDSTATYGLVAPTF
jgi:HK97 family phage major capsid protein